MTELKNCPFCGGKARVYETGNPKEPEYLRWGSGCRSINCTHGNFVWGFVSKERAIEAWNKRVRDAE